MAERSPWYLPRGETLDAVRCARLVEAFRPEVVRVGRPPRAMVPAEQPSARPVAKLYGVRDIVGTTAGHTRSGHARGVGPAHPSVGRHGGPVVIPVCADWETAEVYAVVDLKPWVPEDG